MDAGRMQPVWRFAPSPNGRLHLGHAASALLNYTGARRGGGRFLLRIEDIDPARCRPEFEQAVYDDLQWLGLDWETPVLRQSEHFPRYQAALAGLRAEGLVYACFCSRGDIARAVPAEHPRDWDGALVYPGTCRRLSAEARARRIAAGEPHAWRLNVAVLPPAFPSPSWREAASVDFLETREAVLDWRGWGDVILASKHAPASYHLCVVLDDALQGVTHVVRGRDLYPATSVHRVLQTLMNLPAPLYFHHPLMVDDEQRKLSKRLGSTGLAELRREGVTADDIWRMLGFQRQRAKSPEGSPPRR